MSITSQPLSQALNPRRASMLPTLLLVAGMLVALGAAAYGYIESRRSETVVIAARPIPYGRQIVAEDLATIELPLHRPAQMTGIGDASMIVGRWAAREIGADDLLRPAMLLDAPPDQPVFPNGRRLERNHVPLPFPTTSIGPLSDRDLVNIGFIADDARLCAGGGDPLSGRAYACRFLTGVPVLYVESGTAYLEVTPYQAHAIWALQAAGVQLWGERYGRASDALTPVESLDASAIDQRRLAAPLAEAGNE
jgi:hypothetical protein